MFGRRRRPPSLPPEIVLSAPAAVVRLRTSARARRFTLRPTGPGAAVLTLPESVGEAEARAFLERHRGWLRDALERVPRPVEVAPGVLLPVDGEPVEIARAAAPRARTRLEGGRLLVGADAPPGPAVAAWLKARARQRLGTMAEAHAATLGRRLDGIGIRDTRSRWGSCSAAGRLSFSWRIAMAPPEVQAYLAAHEAAHLVEMNHSPRFWAVLARLMPDYRRPQGWLKREGRGLHRYRFEP